MADMVKFRGGGQEDRPDAKNGGGGGGGGGKNRGAYLLSLKGVPPQHG